MYVHLATLNGIKNFSVPFHESPNIIQVFYFLPTIKVRSRSRSSRIKGNFSTPSSCSRVKETLRESLMPCKELDKESSSKYLEWLIY